MKLSIIIVSWNVERALQHNLEALFKSKISFEFEVFVVDNNSSDNSVEMIRNKFPQVKLLINHYNFGFSRANNQAIKLSQGEYILLLNPDMRVKENTINNMISWADNNLQALVSSCHLIDDHGLTIRHTRHFPKLRDQLIIVLKLPHIISGLLNSYLNTKFDYTKPAKVDSVRGSFFLVNRKKYLSLSGKDFLLDEDYFIWFEEVDFCKQVSELGGEVWYTPVAECYDYIGKSFFQVDKKQTQKYFRDSMLKYFSKWEKPWKVRVLKFAWRIINILI